MATVGWNLPTARPSRWQVGPPGVLFYLVTTAAVLGALDASSRNSLGAFLLAAPIWFVIAAVWFVRVVMAASRTGLRMPVSRWLRWLGVPLVLGLVFAITLSDAPFDTRLAFSRGGMDQMAADVMAGGPTERGWVGLYPVGTVERTANGLRFVVDDSGLYRLGFAYAPSGEPSLTDDNYSPLWTGASYEPVGDGWWLWTEAWD